MNITSILLNDIYESKQTMMNALAQENFCADQVLSHCDPALIATANSMVLSTLDVKIKSGQGLMFEEAFSGMLLVVAATNNPIRGILFPEMSFPEAIAKGVGFLQVMATREAFFELSPEEIAGMVAAGALDLIFRPSVPEVVETCGMGGDRGWDDRTVKTINASTLSGLVLASLGVPVFKHGSYGNTAKVGSTDVPINFGANIYHHSGSEILELFAKTNFWFSDAHSVKTIHYLSHLLMVETVNHIVGPMTIPIAKDTKLFKLMGVNHHINPEAIAKAYIILHRRGLINLGGAIVLTGLSEMPQNNEHLDPEWVKKHSFLDEISPKATLVSVAREEQFLGNFLLTHNDFAVDPLPEDELKVQNATSPLMKANEAAIRGINHTLADYLARNAALALLPYNGFDSKQPFAELPSYYQRCLHIIDSGEAFRTLMGYVKSSGGEFRSWL